MSGIGGHVNRSDRRRRLDPPPMTKSDVLPVIEGLARFQQEFLTGFVAASREYATQQRALRGTHRGRGA